MRAFTQSEPDSWHNLLHYATFSYNNTINSTTGHSPHSLVFGFDVEIPDNIYKSPPSYYYDSYKHELQNKLKNAREIAKKLIQEKKIVNKKYYDRNSNVLDIKINDLVLKRNDVKKSKFENPYSGPYRVEKIISPATILIRIGNKSVKVHADKLIKAKANYGDKTPPPITET